MRLVAGIAVAVVMLTPAHGHARRHHEDAFASEVKQQRAARLAEIQDRQERLERVEERQLERDIDRLSVDDDDDVEDDDLNAHVDPR